MIHIVKPGMGNQEMWLEEDSAECLLEALAEVLGAKVDFDWAEKEVDADHGSIHVGRV
jgi:hypothetical protein